LSYLTLTILSDTHELHRELLPLPGGDLLVHCGDFSMFGKSMERIRDFASWFQEQPYRYKVLTFGNHEFPFEADPSLASVFTDVNVLNNSGVCIEGLRIWGSPVTPLYGGAFGMSSALDRAKCWSRIPRDTNLLITHGPPLGILDGDERAGDAELLDAVSCVRPLLHAFGHIHGASGVVERNGTTFINAARLTAEGHLIPEAMHIRIPFHQSASK
jgi:predicted phosphohydrolase